MRGRSRHSRRRRWTASATGLLVLATASLLIAEAVLSDGFPVRHVDLNDGGVWVSSDRFGLFGRLNQPAGALDAAFNPPGSAQSAYVVDVLQDGAAVAAWDKGSGLLYAVDVRHGAAVGKNEHDGLPVPAHDQVQMNGGTLAVLDPTSGAVWATHADPTDPLLSVAGVDTSSRPLATVPVAPGGGAGAAALTVGVDGIVYVVSAGGTTAVIGPRGTGFAKPVYSRFGTGFTAVTATVIGDRLVALDPGSGRLMVAGGSTASIDIGAAGAGEPGAVLQLPGPDSARVLVETATALLAVDLAHGAVTTVSSVPAAVPAAAAWLDGCVHAVWGGPGGGYLHGCGDGPVAPVALRDPHELTEPEFRINRHQIVLNDLGDGSVWDLNTRDRVDNWLAVRPLTAPTAKASHGPTQPGTAAQSRPPLAVADRVGVRPGRTTLLHLLDNDSDPAGGVLTITGYAAADNPQVRLAIAPDAQTIAITVPTSSPTIHFRYTIDDGHANSSADVTVEVRKPDENGAPTLAPHRLAHTWTVPAGGHISIATLDDWRDPDGDPITLAGATVKDGQVTTTTDGSLNVTAPPSGGIRVIDYQVTDGIAAPVAGSVTLDVQSPSGARAVAPISQPDVARGQVGQPITLRPLDNDIPGSDPADPTAKLVLASDVASQAGTVVVTNSALGTVVVTARKAGLYSLSYTAAFGDAPFASGAIRVDVTPDPTSPAPPVAMPDTAVLHGQLPATVDVLANDFDPAGKILVVQHAAAVGSEALQVAVISGRWLRITAPTAASSATGFTVDYTVTDGVTAPVTGQVSVTQISGSASTAPATVDDYVTVRSGDQVTVPVLDNDTDPAGVPLTLAADIAGAPAPGEMKVTGVDGSTGTTDGAAYVAGNQIRYVAPTDATKPLQVTVAYVAQDAVGDQATGQVHVTVTPPGTRATDRPPSPLPVEARAVAGQTVTVPIPTSGIDPDGDSVAVTGIASGPTLGRVLSVNATSLTYQAYPTSSGTDLFTYQVSDVFGASGVATVRVGVTPPGAPQPPVAVDDEITAAPGATVRVNVLANDLISAGDAVTIQNVAGAKLIGATGPIEVTVPPANGKPLLVFYTITDGIGDPSSATLTVRGKDGVDLPPTANDVYPPLDPGGRTVTVTTAKCCDDPDGDVAGLTIDKVFGTTSPAGGSSVTLPVTGAPQTIPYEVRDAGGAVAVGLIHMPSAGGGGPYVKPNSVITLARDGSTTVALADYIVDPAGKPVRITTVQGISTSPAGVLKARNVGESSVALTTHGYTGPAALTMEVTDGRTLSDPAARVAVVTIPVQVGPPTPVLFCPTDPLAVIEGGAAISVDTTVRCYAWVADPSTLPGLAYTATWVNGPAGVEIGGSGQHVFTVRADSTAVPGSVGKISIGIVGHPGVTADLTVRVIAAPRASVEPIVVDGVKAGDTARIDFASYVHSRLSAPAVSVVSVVQRTGLPATVGTPSGSTVTIVPGSQSHGTMTFVATVTDVADATRQDRWVTAGITLHVLGVPDAPGTPSPGRTLLSESALLSWPTPANNGAPIDVYEVDWPGGQQTCQASPCLIRGLHNGTHYQFTVRAHNVVGWGQPSPKSTPVDTPNAVPGPVADLVTALPQDGTLQLSWSKPPVNKGTPVTKYQVTWAGGRSASTSATSLRVTGLVNDNRYTFTVIPVNDAGNGTAATVAGQSAGAPGRPGPPTFSVVNSADSSTRAVRISWPAIDPNGPGPTTYTLTRTGGGTKVVCSDVTATSCDDDGIVNDGTTYSYSLVAANAVAATVPAGHTSPPGQPTLMQASATPDPIGNESASPTGTDGQADVRFDVPPSRGLSSTVQCLVGGNSCGTWTFPTSGQNGVTKTINGLSNGQTSTIQLQLCNGSGGGAGAGTPCDSPVSADVVTYGPLKNISLNLQISGPQVIVVFGVDPNGRPANVRVQTSTQTQTYTTGNGDWNYTIVDDMGYNATDTVTVTVTDSGRSPLTITRSATTGSPPASVQVSRGAPCGFGGNPACVGSGSCTTPGCAYIHVKTSGFGGNVTCVFNSQHGNIGFFNQLYGPNDDKDSKNFYGFPGTWVTVTCGGVQGSTTW